MARRLLLTAWLLTGLFLCGCPESKPDPSASPSAASVPGAPAEDTPAYTTPSLPALPEQPAPSGFELRTIRHETIHARLLVPTGVEPRLERDENGYPRVTLTIAEQAVFLQFDSGVGQLGVSLRKQPPTVYSLPVIRSSASDFGVAAWYQTKLKDTRVLGVAPGVKCSFSTPLSLPEATLEQIFTVCSSLRSPPPGKWRAATKAERAHGGMTAVPDGAWVESALPSTPGALLRPGRFTARLHAGRFVVSGAACPASFDELSKAETPESSVELKMQRTKTGHAWIRMAMETFSGDTYPGSTIVLAPRTARCCRVEFAPWLTHPSAAELDYAVALCDTYRAN